MNHVNKTNYSLSRKTMNTRENFWNVYCFATNQMRDETAKDTCNHQTAASSHDLTKKNELAFPRQIFKFTVIKC